MDRAPETVVEVEKEPQKRRWYSPYIFDLKFSTVTQFIFSLALIFVGIAQFSVYTRQAKIMGEQAKIAQGQLEITVAQSRPWIRMANIQVSKVDIQKDLVRISVGYIYENSGHIPAQKVLPIAKVIPTPITKSGIESIDGKRLCDDAKGHRDELEVIGGALFPGQVARTFPKKAGTASNKLDPTSEANNFDLPMRDIIDNMAVIVGSDPPSNERRMLDLTTFWIVGCLIYTFDGSKDVHGSSFMWILTALGPGTQAIDVSKVAVLDVANLKLTEGRTMVFAD